jgi:hypothetical protein
LHVRCRPGPAIDCAAEATALIGVQVPSHGWPTQRLRSAFRAAFYPPTDIDVGNV